MGFLPKTMGMRPRLACEMRADGLVAARADDFSGTLSAVERVLFIENAASMSGVGRAEKVTALRRALDAVSGRGREVTLVVPDPAARVLLVDFDELPSKAAEGLPVVRFRLKKLLPFDADDAAVSYQIMSQSRASIQVLAVAMPRETLADYEGMVREAGYEPGALLPSTLAALAGLDEDAGPVLVVNAGRDAVTTAIVKDGILLLHRTVDLAGGKALTVAIPSEEKPVAVEAFVPAQGDESGREASRDTTIAAIAARFAAMEGQTMPVRVVETPPMTRVGAALASGTPQPIAPTAGKVSTQNSVVPAEEIAQAVSVAAAYFEDTLGMEPQIIFSAGPLGAETLERLLGASARVEEMAGPEASHYAGRVPASWIAGVRGALRS